MSKWKSVCEMPEDFFGDVWVFSKHLKEPELAYTSLAGRRHGKLGGERLFQEIHAVFDADGVHKEYYEDVSHYMVVIPPAPPVTEAKPEAMEIKTERGLVTLQVYEPPVSVWISQMLGEFPEDVRLDTTEQIRQVISWLQQVVDWREAQDAAK